jgi:opacity protein-like surface antigen
MSMFSRRFGLALIVAMLCLGAQAAHAQSSPLNYWIPGWPMGFSGDAGENPNAYGNFPSFDFRDVGNGSSYARYNFSNGFFVGSQRSSMGFGSLGQSSFNNFGSMYSEGVQFGYSLKNSGGLPVTFYAGFDTLKYNPGIGNAFTPFDASSSTVPGYSAHAGIEYKPTSNLSLSLGFGYTEQSGRLDTDTKSPSLSNASQFDLVGGRR